MPLSDHARWRVALRALGTVVALASAVAAIWLIAIGDSSTQVRIGVVLGLWSALLGSATLFGTRTGAVPEGGLRSDDLDRVVEASSLAARGVARKAAEQAAGVAAREAVAALQEANSGREVERRRTAEVERERDEATRREFALSLELMLRREMERVLRDELDALRSEVAGLRNDLIEKVPGQIRLERIETTRLIGSDLEALQAEVRRLAEERVALGGAPAPAITLGSIPATVRAADVVAPVPPRPAPDVTAWSEPQVSTPVREPAPAPSPEPESVREPEPVRDAEPVREPEPMRDAEPEPVREPEPVPAPEPVRAPEPVVAAVPEPDLAAAPEPEPQPTQVRDVDPFAGLPRLSRWVDPYADADAAAADGTDPAVGAGSGPDVSPVPPTGPTADGDGDGDADGGIHAIPDGSDDVEVGPRYVGRRRQPSDDAPAAHAGRAVHAVPDPVADEPEPATRPESAGRRHAREDAAEAEARAGGRRRRHDDDERGGHARPELVPDDVLARLLGR